MFDFLHYFAQVYLNDIFIDNKILKHHRLHVDQVLESLKEAKIKANINKCEFHIQEKKFLDLIISTKDI